MPQIKGERGGRTGKINWVVLRHMMEVFKGHGNWIVALEALADVVPGMAGRGRSMGTMIGEFHLLREAIESAGIPIREFQARTWQAAYGLNKGLLRRPVSTPRDKAALTRERRAQREERMFQWANTEWLWAGGKFGDAWNSGTVAAAMIGRYQYEQEKMHV